MAFSTHSHPSFCAFSFLNICSISLLADNPILFFLKNFKILKIYDPLLGHSLKFHYYFFTAYWGQENESFIFHFLSSTPKQSDSSGVEYFVILYCNHIAVHHIAPLCEVSQNLDHQPESCLDLFFLVSSQSLSLSPSLWSFKKYLKLKLNFLTGG